MVWQGSRALIKRGGMRRLIWVCTVPSYCLCRYLGLLPFCSSAPVFFFFFFFCFVFFFFFFVLFLYA